LAVRYAALMSQLRKSPSVVIRRGVIRDDWNNVGCMTIVNLMDASAHVALGESSLMPNGTSSLAVRIFRSSSAFVSKPRADVAILQGKQRAERQTEGFGVVVGAITLQ
jgi:hypothetical protein